MEWKIQYCQNHQEANLPKLICRISTNQHTPSPGTTPRPGCGLGSPGPGIPCLELALGPSLAHEWGQAGWGGVPQSPAHVPSGDGDSWFCLVGSF